MKDTIRNAFKALDEIIEVPMEPIKSRALKEAVEDEIDKDIDLDIPENGADVEGSKEITLKDLFEEAGAYVLTHDFKGNDGLIYSLFIEGLTEDGEGCDVIFEDFDITNIGGVLIEILDEERDFISNISSGNPEWNDLSTTISVIEGVARDTLTGVGNMKAISEFEPDDEFEEPEELEADSLEAEPLEGESEEETQEKIDKHIIPDHRKEESLEEETLEEYKLEGKDKMPHKHKLFKKSKSTDGKITESASFKVGNKEEMEEAEEVLDAEEEEEPVEQIVDVNADLVTDLKKSYIGDTILRCPTFKTMIYKSPEDLIKPEDDDEDGLYNEEEECPHCGATDGFELVGQVASLDVKPDTGEEEKPAEPTTEPEAQAEEPAPEEEQPAEEAPAEEEARVTLIPDEGEVTEDLTEETGTSDKWGVYQSVEEYAYKQNPELKIGFITSNLTKEEAEKEAADRNSPESKEAGLSYEAKPMDYKSDLDKFKDSAKEDESDKEEESEEKEDESTEMKESYQDVILESLNEIKFDSLVKKYLNEVYSNIDSYVTVDGHVDNKTNKVIIEGQIKFKSGKLKDTKFVFEAREITKRGKMKLVGVNETFANKKAFTLVGAVDGTNLLSESLTYSYKVADKKVYGQVKNPIKV